MLKLVYTPTMQGAPDDFGDAVDTMAVRDEAGAETLLQSFAKAASGFVAPEPALEGCITTWLASRLDRARPVIVMVHGYNFDPEDTHRAGSPFDTVYGLPSAGRPSNLSWLPLVGECDEHGGSPGENAIAFAYKSVGTAAETNNAGWSNNYQLAVFDLAPIAGRALAAVLAALGEHDVPVRLLAHSLGTRTAGRAIGLLRARPLVNLDRAVLLDGAEFSADAAINFKDCGLDVFNIVNRGDLVLRKGAEQMCHPFRENNSPAAAAIGFAALGGNPRWLDLRIDDPATVAWFGAARAPDGTSYHVNHVAEEASHPAAELGHWACYTNMGNRALVRDLLASPVMTVANFISHGVPPIIGCNLVGTFDGVTIPPVPTSVLDRRRRAAQARFADASGGGVGGSGGSSS